VRPAGAILIVVLAAAAAIPAQRRSAASLGRSGWDAINSGRALDAATAFEEALQQAPQDPALLLGAGIAAHLLGRADDARRNLVGALTFNPAMSAASLLLGEVLYQAGDLDGAITVYEQALPHAPATAQFTRKLEIWRKEMALHGGFTRRLGDHFTVLFEGPAEAQLAERAVAILEAAYWRIGMALYTYPTEAITVVLYTREQFQDITQSPAWAGGAFDGRIRLPVQGALKNPREFERVLAHEFTHAIVRSIAPRGVPVWLDEGLAVQFEGGDLDQKRAQVSGARDLPTLDRLERSFATLPDADARLAYAQSAVAVDTLLKEAGAPALVNLLTDIGNGVPFAEAFGRRMLISYDEFQKRQH
jgi:tetratricopeptide (TPR) repeat protein